MGDQQDMEHAACCTQWEVLEQLCDTKCDMDGNVNLIYQEYKFPLEIRHHCAEWIEEQNW